MGNGEGGINVYRKGAGIWEFGELIVPSQVVHNSGDAGQRGKSDFDDGSLILGMPWDPSGATTNGDESNVSLGSAGAAILLEGISDEAELDVSSVTARQIPGSHDVAVSYSLSGPSATDIDVSIEVSGDMGGTWTVPVSAVVGDVGGEIRPGVAKRITWAAGQDLAEVISSSLILRISAFTADETVSAPSREFRIDTEVPDFSEIVQIIGDEEINENFSKIPERSKLGVYYSDFGIPRPLVNLDQGFQMAAKSGDFTWSLSDIVDSGELLFMMNGGLDFKSPGHSWYTSPSASVQLPPDESDQFLSRKLFPGRPVSLYKRIEVGPIPLILPEDPAKDYKTIDPTAKKLIVVIHGWNPSSDSDPYSEMGFSSLVGKIQNELVRADTENGVTGWDIFAYNWAADAATGPVSIGGSHTTGKSGNGQENGTQAAEVGYLHGLHLGNRLATEMPGLENIHFIAHSAGTWVARSASLVLQSSIDASQLDQSVTLLDPYNPSVGFDDWIGTVGEDSALDTRDLESWPGQIDSTSFENILSLDKHVGGTNERYEWGARGINRKVGDSIFGTTDIFVVEIFDSFRKWNGHGGPINFYSFSIDPNDPDFSTPEERRGSLEMVADVGWTHGPHFNEVKTAMDSGFGEPNFMALAAFTTDVHETYGGIHVWIHRDGWVTCELVSRNDPTFRYYRGPVKLMADGSFEIGLWGDTVLSGQFGTASRDSTLVVNLGHSDDPVVYLLPAESRPDVKIGKSFSRLRGNNVYSSSGAGQMITEKLRSGKNVTRYGSVENDGVASSLTTVYGSKGINRFKTHYSIFHASGRLNVTGQVVSRRLNIRIPFREHRNFRINIKRGRKVPKNSRMNALLDAYGSGVSRDRGIIHVRAK